jgi:predicted nucleic acid-binding Zn ribbon protein
MSDDTLAECPDCGTPGERQISAGIGFVFKGSGFYETDYKRAGKTHTKYETDKSDEKEPVKADGPDATTSKSTESSKTGEKP